MAQDAFPPDEAAWPLRGSGSERPAPPTPPSLASQLAQAIGYNLDTLATNRVGQITEDQISDLNETAARNLWQIALGAGGFLLFIAVTSLTKYVPTKTGAVPLPRGGWPLWCVLPMLGLILGVGLLSAGLNWGDARSKRAVMAEGVVTRFKIKGNSYFRVNKLEFRVPPGAYDALADGKIYRVYYTPYSKTFLSLEPI